MIGNNVPLNIEWTKISEKLSQEVKRVLSNKWTSLTTRILHINAVVCSKYTYPVSHTFTPPNAIEEMDKFYERSITRSKTVQTSLFPFQSMKNTRKHAMTISAMDIPRYFHSLQAKPLVEMFSNYNKRTPIYEFFWQVDLDLLSAKYKFRSIEHLINSTVQISTKNISNASQIQPNVIQATSALKLMKFFFKAALNNTYGFEEMASEVIWENPKFINPTTSKPWSIEEHKHKIASTNIYHVSDLLVNFKKTHIEWMLRSNPIFSIDQFKSTQTLNQEAKLTHNLINWQAIINSISPNIRYHITSGNADPTLNAFYLDTRNDHLYQIKISNPLTLQLWKHAQQENTQKTFHSPFVATNKWGRAGDPIIHNNPRSPKYPLAHQLRKVSFKQKTIEDIIYITPYRYALQVLHIPKKMHTLSLPPLAHEDSKIDNNIIGNKSTFKNIAKQYRQKESQLPPYLIPKQQQLIAQHHNMNQENLWRHIMTQLINLYIDPITRDIILKLIHNSLYMGVIGRNHQINTKKMHKYKAHAIYNENCRCHGPILMPYVAEYSRKRRI